MLSVTAPKTCLRIVLGHGKGGVQVILLCIRGKKIMWIEDFCVRKQHNNKETNTTWNQQSSDLPTENKTRHKPQHHIASMIFILPEEF